MDVVLNGLFNFLSYIEENWGMIVAICVLAASIYRKLVAFFDKSQEEQLAIAKVQISETMLKWVTIAEQDYLQWVSAGEIKRSQVIDQIFEKYPVLSKVTDQNEVIQFIDDTIDEALKTMRKIFEENASDKSEE